MWILGTFEDILVWRGCHLRLMGNDAFHQEICEENKTHLALCFFRKAIM